MTQEKANTKNNPDKKRRKILGDMEKVTLKGLWGNKCAYCEVKQDNLVLDHIIPFSKGGSCELENLAPSCRKCNSRKRDNELPDFYLALILSIAKDKASRARRSVKQKKNRQKNKSKKTPCKARNKTKHVRGRRNNDIQDMWPMLPEKAKVLFSIVLDNLISDLDTSEIEHNVFYNAGLSTDDCFNNTSFNYRTEFYSDILGDWTCEPLFLRCGGVTNRDGSGHLSFRVHEDFKHKVSKMLRPV